MTDAVALPAKALPLGGLPRGLTRLDYLLYAIIVFAWSTSWIALHLQLGTVAPEVSVAWRFAGAAMVMFAYAGATGARLAFPLWAHGRFALLGFLIFGFNFVCFYYGGMSTPSGLLAVVFSCTALFNLVLGVLVFRQPIERRVALGAALGLAGVFLMFSPRIFGTAFDHAALLGLAYCIVGTLSFCCGNMVSVATQRAGIGIVSANAWGMAYGAVFLALAAYLRGDSFAFDPSPVYVASLLWLTLVSSVIAFACYLTLLGRIGAARAGYATVLFPIFALVVSTFVEGYVWTPAAFAGLALALAGNVIVLRKGR